MHTETVELPSPEVIWARIALWSALMTAEGDAMADPVSGGRIDHRIGRNWFTVIRYPGDRAVLFGWDESAETEYLDEPYDPLDCAPDWVPIAELNSDVLAGQTGFVYWWDGGRWHRTAVAVSDGAMGVLGLAAYEEHFAAECALESFGCAGCGTGIPDDDEDDFLEDDCECDHRETIDALRRVVETLSLEMDSLEVLTAATDTTRAAVFDFLRRAHVVRGSVLPVDPVPPPPPLSRTRRAMMESAHNAALVQAMRAASELPRDPVAPTVELVRVLDEIATWDPGQVDRIYHVAEGAIHSVSEDWNTRHVPSELLRDLWRAEATEQGRWLFIRFRTEDERIVIDRAYDHWPQWYPVAEHGNGWCRHDVLAELATRARRWHPGWASIAADDYAYIPG